MPKDEIDPEDPLELVAIGFPVEDDREMVLCVVDEYVRIGYGPQEVERLFAEARYAMTHEVYRRRGAAWVRQCIAEVMAHWGA
jgi:hypothetical protein